MSSPLPRSRLILAALFAATTGIAFAAQAMLRSEDERLGGTFTVVERTDEYLVAAPHGEFDAYTGQMARAICERTRWSCQIARGFETDAGRINVNRPTEGVRLAETTFSDRAARVYDAYMTRVQNLAPHLKLYVELHGNDHPDSRDAIEIATAGISESWAHTIRDVLHASLAKHGVGHLTPRIDVLESIRYSASHNREFGALSLIQPALHIELPGNARKAHRADVIAALAEALAKVAKAGATAPQFALR